MREFTVKEKEMIKSMYNDGETISDIRKKLKCKSSSLDNYLRDNGFKKRPKNTLKETDFLSNTRKYKVDESYFESIDDPNKAYWLGFLYADGNVRLSSSYTGGEKGGTLELTLKSEDEYHIESMLYDLRATYPVKRREVRIGEKTYIASRTQVHSRKMANDLINQGCVPAKSLVLKPPTLRKDLNSHFIRGYFDGDGCVGFYPEHRSFSFSILGTKEVLEYIKKCSGISHGISITKPKNKNVYTINISGPTAVKQFYSYIYSGKTVFLERKWDKALSMMKYLGADTCRSEVAVLADLLD